MPASMISAPTGGRPKVIGKSIAIVATVPMPGSTPTSVPTSAPSRQNSTFIGENATPKPRSRFARSSDMATSTDLETGDELPHEYDEGVQDVRELIDLQLRRVGLRLELERQIEQIDEQQDASEGHDR